MSDTPDTATETDQQQAASVASADTEPGSALLDQLEADLDTVEASLAALDADDLDKAETLADSLHDKNHGDEGSSDET